ncbi:hypothetical protein D5W64_13040 [Salmonella enterica subsp. enterica serovar Saintpaul]|nr:hypothetical protein [Salmonella enterica subsp. enterica serovar Saintpaul]
MSHLAHIVRFKQSLINEGLTDPNLQIEIVRTAYVKALITVGYGNKLDQEQCIQFNRYILSYWNEVTPVNGLLVMTMIGNFFRALEAALNKPFTFNKLKLEVVPKIDTPIDADWEDMETYRDLVQTLVDEANHKLPQFMETNQVN